MTIVKHELKLGRNSLVVWTAAISLLLGICVLIYPEMEKQMTEISAAFANMGSFSQAFGLDKINYGEFPASLLWNAGTYWGWAALFLPRCWESPHWQRKKKNIRQISC